MKIKLYVVGLLGTNCFLVWDEISQDAMIIDPGDYKKAISSDITGKGLRLKYIVLTHGHGDHIGGVPEFKVDFPDAQLVCGEGDLELMRDTDMNSSAYFCRERTVLEADLIIGEGDMLMLGDIAFKALETPGHTKGSLSFYVSGCDTELTGRQFSGTVFSGDLLFQNSIGRTDMPGGDFAELKTSIQEKLFCLPGDTLVLPGHMDASTIENEKLYNPFLR